jgi:hypothetical protein
MMMNNSDNELSTRPVDAYPSVCFANRPNLDKKPSFDAVDIYKMESDRINIDIFQLTRLQALVRGFIQRRKFK